MLRLPDDAIVVRGGRNLPESFAKGSGVAVDFMGRIEGVSVNSNTGLTLEELTSPDAATGYPGIPHTQVGVTTVGAVRELGGEVTSSPNRTNPNHATLSGLTAAQASQLFRPTMTNPQLTQRRKQNGG